MDEKNLEGPGTVVCHICPHASRGSKFVPSLAMPTGYKSGDQGSVRGHALPLAFLTWALKIRAMQKEEVCLGAPGTTWLPHFETPLTSNTKKPPRSWKRPPNEPRE